MARLLRGGHGAALKRTDRPRRRQRAGHAHARLPGAGRAGRRSTRRPAAAQPLALAVEAATLLDVLTDAVAGEVGGGPIHNRLALAWGWARAARAPT